MKTYHNYLTFMGNMISIDKIVNNLLVDNKVFCEYCT